MLEITEKRICRQAAGVIITVGPTLGRGMPPYVAARAVEPFFTTKPIGQGTGLGLSQVFGFGRQLGGHAALRNAPSDGIAIALLPPGFFVVPTRDTE